MGVLQERHGITLMGVAPDVCQECGVRHNPGAPHNRDSLYYQYHFYDQFGRWPTWDDAMAHCSEEVKAIWREALAGHGIDVPEEQQEGDTNGENTERGRGPADEERPPGLP